MNELKEINMPRVACQSEFFVPMEHASSALQAVREIARCWPGWPTSEALEDLHERIPVFHCEVKTCMLLDFGIILGICVCF